MILLFDQDEVLADFEGGFAKVWQARYPNEIFIKPEDRTTFYTSEDYPENLRGKIREINRERGFFRNLTVIPGAIKAVKYAIKKGHCVYICTAPISESRYCIQEKLEWIKEHLGKEFLEKTIFTKDKTLVNGDVLIDDNPNVTGIMTPSWEHIIFDRPQNRQITDKRRLDWSNYKKVLGI